MSHDQEFNSKMLSVQKWATVSQLWAAMAALGMLYFASETLKESNKQSAEIREYNGQLIRLLESPVLALENTKISLELHETDGGEVHFAAQPIAAEKLDGKKVPIIQNYGSGAAINVRGKYVITAINGKSLEPRLETDLDLASQNLTPGARVAIYEVPRCIAEDETHAIREIKGFMEFGFNHEGGRARYLSQSFTGTTDYGMQPRSRLNFIFKDLPIDLGNTQY
jgi:hypothetical protein